MLSKITMNSPFVVEGKSILVTGAASGIGRATALLCAQMGAQVTITDLNEEQLKATLCFAALSYREGI